MTDLNCNVVLDPDGNHILLDSRTYSVSAITVAISYYETLRSWNITSVDGSVDGTGVNKVKVAPSIFTMSAPQRLASFCRILREGLPLMLNGPRSKAGS